MKAFVSSLFLLLTLTALAQDFPPPGDRPMGPPPGRGPRPENRPQTDSAPTQTQTQTTGDTIICEEIMGEGKIEKGELCYDDCKPKRGGLLGWAGIGEKKQGLERKSCIDCLVAHPEKYTVKAEYLPKKPDESVRVSGVTTRNGVVCHDSQGRVVTGTGTSCPAPAVTTSGSTRFSCSSSSTIEECRRSAGGNGNGNGSINGGGNRRPPSSSSFSSSSQDCVECNARSRNGGSNLSGLAEIVGALAAPLAAVGTAYFQSRAQIKSQQAWANAAATGFEQCQISQNNYLNYLASNELSGLTPEQQSNMNCNGYSLNSYAGLSGVGYNSLYGAGYSTGFLGGMMGQYGSYNPYGMYGSNSMGMMGLGINMNMGGYGMFNSYSPYSMNGMNNYYGMSSMYGSGLAQYSSNYNGMYGGMSYFPNTGMNGLTSGMFYNFR